MYHFMSGYTAKVAGTERGVTEPQATFSSCFGAPFLPRHPTVYGEMLRKLMTKTQCALLSGQHRLDGWWLWCGQTLPDCGDTHPRQCSTFRSACHSSTCARTKPSVSTCRSRWMALIPNTSTRVKAGSIRKPMMLPPKTAGPVHRKLQEVRKSGPAHGCGVSHTLYTSCVIAASRAAMAMSDQRGI